MMIRVCKDCGFEKLQAGCANCNQYCPICGGRIEKRDYVQHMQMKEIKKNADESSQSG